MALQVKGELFFEKPLSDEQKKFFITYQNIIDGALNNYPRKHFTIFFSQFSDEEKNQIHQFQNNLNAIGIHVNNQQAYYILASSYPGLKYTKNKIKLDIKNEKNDLMSSLHVFNFLFLKNKFLYPYIENNSLIGELDVNMNNISGKIIQLKYQLKEHKIECLTLKESFPFLVEQNFLDVFKPLIEYHAINQSLPHTVNQKKKLLKL